MVKSSSLLAKEMKGSRLILVPHKLSEVLENDEWPFENLDSVLGNITIIKHTTALCQVEGHFTTIIEEGDK